MLAYFAGRISSCLFGSSLVLSDATARALAAFRTHLPIAICNSWPAVEVIGPFSWPFSQSIAPICRFTMLEVNIFRGLKDVL